MAHDVDVVVVGAGVAGLAAARALHSGRIDLTVLEARERIGGRILTQHDPELPCPIELGAEFVHGRAPELERLAADAKLLLCDAEGGRWRSHEGRLKPLEGFWEQLDAVLRRLDARSRDHSFEEFLARRPGGARLARSRTLVRQWVEGFHAADPARASTQALAEGGSPGEDERERRMARFLSGYDGVPRWLARELGDRIRLGSVVTRIAWSDRRVDVHIGEPGSQAITVLSARAAIVSVPLGVLQTAAGERGAITFEPSLSSDRVKRGALDGMAMGAVVRVVARLRERFWTSDRFSRRAGREDFDRLAFLHTDDARFPVWWTLYPVRAPVLVGWSGGPRAHALSALTPLEIKDAAVAALGTQFGLTKREAAGNVEAVWTHDWQNDPFSRGAYSYTVVGGAEASRQLARPLRGTLFFAGEASDVEGRTGTVHGALATGERAARQVRRALGL